MPQVEADHLLVATNRGDLQARGHVGMHVGPCGCL